MAKTANRVDAVRPNRHFHAGVGIAPAGLPDGSLLFSEDMAATVAHIRHEP
ncbi:hypothetical protein [Cupriavidus sp.]|uniref:hypothetical protein n=1 Tax=Cupriavidus sp. TaxID=1873897 RepID=UPI0025C5F0F2|nr:hypothetical protein [Cupriavidus sp.]MCA3193056.1 hypothetical protein [Cupriavidus sp.]MCA3195908.1 hypothetical protein [Cupriavidus sp.]MCA3204809.1 hypothetical protein [Cupriavidus sp.]MCA3206962.1 hypothetical protein [Cupriavidus sp.]MCA3232377.1 hypothetical protein [Cupriavidus sp.]